MKRIALFLTVILFFLSAFFIFKKIQATEKKEKFNFWTIQLKPIYEKEIYKIINKFEQKHPNIKVVWVDIPIQEAQKRTLATILSSTPPDLINLNPDFSLILAQRNALEFFDEKDVEQFDKNLIKKLTYADGIYAIPFYFTSPVTIYNKEIYKNCINNEIIKSYDELYETSLKLKKCTTIPTFATSLNENDTLSKILNKYDITSLKTAKEKEEIFKLYTMFNKMYKNNFLPKDIMSINHREIIEKYMSNQALMIVAGSNFINMIEQNAPDIYKKTDISEQLVGKNKKYDISLMNLIIPSKAKNKTLALEFALELTNEENQLKLSKITNVLPANKYALEDDYFKNCSNNLADKARCISAKQLENLNFETFGEENKKAINETINKSLEEILLNDTTNEDTIKNTIEKLANELEILKNN